MGFLLYFLSSILLIVLACFMSKTFNFYFKNFLFALIFLACGMVVSIKSLSSPGDVRNMRWWRYSTHFLRLGSIFNIEIKSKNLKVLNSEDSCVIVSNHQSEMDQIALVDVWNHIGGTCTILAKESIKYMGSLGLGCLLSGVVFVDRKNRTKARAIMADCVRRMRDEKVKIWMYPEGTRSGNNQIDMLPFKKGAFHMAIQAQVPIVPVVFSYYKHQYNTQLRIFDKVKITARVMEPLPTKGMTEDDVDSLLDTCRNRMLKTFYKISTYLPPTVQSSNNLEVKQSKEKIEQNQNELSRSDEMIDRSTAEDDDRRNFCESG
ncbi:1-acyl-sn-glycerol-3-phosphate acyltransferase beta-like isoform X2 [Anneissia japonica]|uniref:1-acyl-sn-glycerol-3-phosphate acyltransferase beta-like isoform X2 n=1 Tax=Anneissia japonica TaxID=1529436 RepID=UPI001425A8AB|nr:1-acyl-sn-glycerol-3-phosphate acyltransferase beta-like isoform X2 [Anneissia japonica]